MTADELAKWTRTRGDSLRVDDLSVVTPAGIFGGRGTLRNENQRFLLKATLSGPGKLPDVNGHYDRAQFWNISGRIEETLPFSAEGLSKEHSPHFGGSDFQQATFALDRLSLVTEETRAHDVATAEAIAQIPGEDASTPSAYLGRAYLQGYKPAWFNGGITVKTNHEFFGERIQQNDGMFRGEFGDFEFALICAGTDCEVCLRVKENAVVTTAQFVATFAAFRSAVAFVHGRETWPQRFTISQGFLTIRDDVYPQRDLPSTPFRLLGEAECANGADLRLALVKATELFLRDDAVCSLAQRALYLCRQSSLRMTPLDVGTLSMCAVFEGLVIGLHSQLASSGNSEEAAAFNAAKAQLAAFSREQESKGVPGFSRFTGLLSSAKPYRLKDALHWLATHLRLRWEPGMQEVFEAWSSERNILAHGSKPKEDLSERMNNQSRIAGAINLIVARLAGYTGLAIYSALEDRRVRLSDDPDNDS